MKYGLIGVIVIIVGLFYFMHKSNKEDAARVAASGQAYTEQQNKTVKVVELQKSLPDLRESDALKLIESPKMSPEDSGQCAGLKSPVYTVCLKSATGTSRPRSLRQSPPNPVDSVLREIRDRRALLFSKLLHRVAKALRNRAFVPNVEAKLLHNMTHLRCVRRWT